MASRIAILVADALKCVLRQVVNEVTGGGILIDA